MNGIREPGGASMVTMTRVPGARPLVTPSAFASRRFNDPVSWYRKAKKISAQTPKPARCHLRGLRDPRTQRPKIAEMVVSREPSRPIQPASGDGRRFSGSNAVAQKATAYHSKGNSSRFQKPGSRGRAKEFAATQATPKPNDAAASAMYRFPYSTS